MKPTSGPFDPEHFRIGQEELKCLADQRAVERINRPCDGVYDPREKPPLICPMTIIVDSNESAPFHFTGIRSDKSDDSEQRPWIVNTARRALWASHKVDVEVNGQIFTKGLADYSIDGMELSIQVERKTKNDLYSTLSKRRDEFQAEIKRLNDTCKVAHVIIECSRRELLMDPPPSSLLNPKAVNRTIISWGDRYPRVHWHCCDSRREAELECFHRLFSHWKHAQETE